MNDVGGFLVSYFDEITALAIFSGVEKQILRDFTSLKFDLSVVPLFSLIGDIIVRDRKDWVEKKSVLTMLIQFVSVSWNLTLFSHDHDKSGSTLWRVWDHLVSSEPNMILFLISAVILIEVKELNDELDPEAMMQIKKFQFTQLKITRYLNRATKISNSCRGDKDFCGHFNSELHGE